MQLEEGSDKSEEEVKEVEEEEGEEEECVRSEDRGGRMIY